MGLKAPFIALMHFDQTLGVGGTDITREGSGFRCACKQVYYCGPVSQKVGWSGHKPKCGAHLAKQIRKRGGVFEEY